MPRKGERKARPFEDEADPHGLVAMMRLYLEATAARGCSPWTVRGIETALSELILWCQERGVIKAAEVTKPMLERYQRHLYRQQQADGRPLSFRTQAWKLSYVRLFFRWLTRQNLVPWNPASEIELPKIPKTLPRSVLSVEEAERVLALPDVATPWGLRDRAILETFYSTGMRRRELVGLHVWDVDFERGTVMIREGKGRKDRVVPIGERALAWIAKYLADVRPEIAAAHDDGTLFLSYHGAGLNADVLTTIVRGYIDKADVGKKGSCHVFRHTAATLMLEGGADIRYIQQMLGHAELSTTQLYTRVSIAKLKAIHDATHPGARLGRRSVQSTADPGALDDSPGGGGR